MKALFLSLVTLVFVLTGCGTAPQNLQAEIGGKEAQAKIHERLILENTRIVGGLKETPTATNNFLEKTYGFGIKEKPKLECKEDGPKDPRSEKAGWALCKYSFYADYLSVGWINTFISRDLFQYYVILDLLKAGGYTSTKYLAHTCKWDESFKDNTSGMNGIFVDCTIEADPFAGIPHRMFVTFFYFRNEDRNETTKTYPYYNLLTFSDAPSLIEVNKEQFIQGTRAFINSGKLYKK